MVIVGETTPMGFLLRYRLTFTVWCTQTLKCSIVPWRGGCSVIGKMHAPLIVRVFLGFWLTLAALAAALFFFNGNGVGMLPLLMVLVVLVFMAGSGIRTDREAGEFLAKIRTVLG